VAAGDLVHAGPVVRVVGQVVDPAQDGHGPGGVGQQHPDTDASGLDLSGADLVKGFLDNAVQGLAGEPGEVDRDVLGGKCLLDVWAQAG
jgi:hypothetical protein